MLKKTLVALSLATPLMALEAQKQAIIDLEMANYFFQGKDFKNAEKYYKQADKNLTQDELKVLVCRNLATISLLNENKKEATKTLESCIGSTDVSLVESSQAFRDVIKLYAEIKADEINPNIQDAKMAAFKRQQEMMKMRMQQGGSAPAPAPAGSDGKVSIGFGQ